MRQRDYDNAMIVLKTLVKHHQAYDGEPLSALKVYQTARSAGQGWLRSVDLSRTFTTSAERLVEVGLAIKAPARSRGDYAFSPSPIGILVTYQHPARFPRPQAAGDKSATRPQAEAPAQWRSVLAGFGIGLSIVAFVLGLIGATVLAGWLVCFAMVCIVLYFFVPARWFRLRR